MKRDDFYGMPAFNITDREYLDYRRLYKVNSVAFFITRAKNNMNFSGCILMQKTKAKEYFITDNA